MIWQIEKRNMKANGKTFTMWKSTDGDTFWAITEDRDLPVEPNRGYLRYKKYAIENWKRDQAQIASGK